MIEAVKLWNEPNNKSHWDFELDKDWRIYSRLVRLAGEAVRALTFTPRRMAEAYLELYAGLVQPGRRVS